MWSAIRKLGRTEAGVTTLEYALLLMVIVVADFLAWSALGPQVEMMVEAGTGSF